MLDFDLRFTEVPLSFQVRVLTSGGIPDVVSDCKLGNLDFPDQMECTFITS